eukprot:UC1_evm1s513
MYPTLHLSHHQNQNIGINWLVHEGRSYVHDVSSQNSIAAFSGILPGHEVLCIDGQVVTNMSVTDLELTCERGGEVIEVVVQFSTTNFCAAYRHAYQSICSIAERAAISGSQSKGRKFRMGNISSWVLVLILFAVFFLVWVQVTPPVQSHEPSAEGSTSFRFRAPATRDPP